MLVAWQMKRVKNKARKSFLPLDPPPRPPELPCATVQGMLAWYCKGHASEAFDNDILKKELYLFLRKVDVLKLD